MSVTHIGKNDNIKLLHQLDGQIYHVFQPIYHLKTNQCYGYEALLRSKNYDTFTLLKIAEEKQKKFDLDFLSIKKSIYAFSQSLKGNGCPLFINIFPSTLIYLASPFLLDFIKVNPVTAHNRIIIAIKGLETIGDFAIFKETIQSLKKAGYRIALNDVANGALTLTTNSITKPDIIKLDKGLSHNLSQSKEKQDCIKRLIHFCGNDIRLMLGGIETFEDLETAKSLGISYGQGAILGEPMPLYHSSL
ncbi:MAG TPA: EAL domain-containing protein [Bacillus bacterium]|nr:EAL domain-containing protein [Bacillus sp. (in: firmicutes)]